MSLTHTKHCNENVWSSQGDMALPAAEIKGDVVLFLRSFAALWGLCKLLQGRWNNWLAYLFISSVRWQPASPGDLAYRQQVKQTGNYCVTFSPGCGSIVDPLLRLFPISLFLLKPLSFLYQLDLLLFICRCLLDFAMSSFSKVICLSILTFEFVYYMENKMWVNETNA